ncbi:DUF6213 family protein [Streptomyces althioticus]|uniref:DUF6213 family protein n=1 Tax=Streptomyces althioticus TaxID=83380 RepID=UPI0036C0DA5F
MVTTVRRRGGGGGCGRCSGGGGGRPQDTVAALTIELAKLADRIDVACIAHSSGTTP